MVLILFCLGNLYREGCRLRCMGVIAHILCSFQGKGYEQIVAKRLVQRLRGRFPKDLTGKISTRRTAESYIANCMHLEIIRRSGGYLHLTSAGEVLLCLADFSNVPPPFHLSSAEKALFLYQILMLDAPCFKALLSHLDHLEEASLTELARTIDYPTYTRLKLRARIHRIGARIEWATDLGLVNKNETSYKLSKNGEQLVSLTDSNSWVTIAKTLFDRISEEPPSYEWFLKRLIRSYLLLANLNPFDVYVKLASLRLHMCLLAFPDWNLQQGNFKDLFLQVRKRNQGKIQLLRSMKSEYPTDVLNIQGRQFKYVHIP